MRNWDEVSSPAIIHALAELRGALGNLVSGENADPEPLTHTLAPGFLQTWVLLVVADLVHH